MKLMIYIYTGNNKKIIMKKEIKNLTPCLFVNCYGFLCHGTDYANSPIKGLNQFGEHIVWWFW